jgi:hypothetical protein
MCISTDQRYTIDILLNRVKVRQIFDVLRRSNIAEERGKDVESKFWATYKKVSNEYDGDILERANDDMAIMLTFVRSCIFMSANTILIGEYNVTISRFTEWRM